jgi:alcohol dehydrogenase
MRITWQTEDRKYIKEVMMDFKFSIPTQIIFGQGASRQVGTITRDLLIPDKRPGKINTMVILDPGVRAAAWLDGIFESIKAEGINFTVFDQVKPNPREEDVIHASLLAKSEGTRIVIAIGGGSTMDTAKGAALLVSHEGTLTDYAGWGKIPGTILSVIAIPTTAGSGSEATSWAVITGQSSHAKLAIGDPNLAPKIALVDPHLTETLPPGITAATGMDVLTHSIEAYICALSNPVNDMLALGSIELVASNLQNAFQDGANTTAREGMMLASTLGGIAINNADVAGVHCLSEGVGSLYDAPHGLINAILLPYFMSYWKAGCGEKFSNIASAFHCDPKPEEAIRQVEKLLKSLRMPSLAEIGIKREDLSTLAELAEGNVSNSSNPVPMTASDYLNILKQAMRN